MNQEMFEMAMKRSRKITSGWIHSVYRHLDKFQGDGCYEENSYEIEADVICLCIMLIEKVARKGVDPDMLDVEVKLKQKRTRMDELPQ